MLSDDLFIDVYKSFDIVKIFYRDSRQLNISVILTQQSPFPSGTFAKEIADNLTGIVIMKSYEYNRTRCLSMKWMEKTPNGIKDIIKYIRREFPEETKPYVYIDLHQDQPHDILAVRSLIFPRLLAPEGKTKVFAPIIFVPEGEDLRNYIHDLKK